MTVLRQRFLKQCGVALLAFIACAAPVATASAQRYVMQRGILVPARHSNAESVVRRPPLGRAPTSISREALVSRLEGRRAVIARALPVLRSWSASHAQMRAAGLRASLSYRHIGRVLQARQDRAGAIRAFQNAATTRYLAGDYDTRDVDLSFRSEMWELAGDLLAESNDTVGAADSYRRAGEASEKRHTTEGFLRAADLFVRESRVLGAAHDERRAVALRTAADLTHRASGGINLELSSAAHRLRSQASAVFRNRTRDPGETGSHTEPTGRTWQSWLPDPPLPTEP